MSETEVYTHVILKKDDTFNQGGCVHTTIDPTGIELDAVTGIYPLIWDYHFNGIIHGSVRNLRLDDGALMGDVTYNTKNSEQAFENLLDIGEIRFGGFYTDVIKSADNTVVTNCRLRAVSSVMLPPSNKESNV